MNLGRFRLPLRLEALELRCVPTSLIVTSLDDTSETGTLRWAIQQANATSQSDVITFAVAGTVQLESALPSITGSVQIRGLGAGQTTISLASSVTNGFSMFRVSGVGNELTLSDMTLANGLETEFSGASGIQVSNQAQLTVRRMVFRNHATHYNGVISINQASATVETSLFEGTTYTEIEHQGVIHNDRGNLWVESSTFHNNSAGFGGIIFTESSPTQGASTTLRNVTITGSTVIDGIIGILEVGPNYPGNTHVDIAYSTIVNNPDSIFALSNLGRGTITLIGNLFANNNSADNNSFASNSFGGTIESWGYNVADTSPGQLNHPSDVVGVDPRLGNFGDNGGPVPTYALRPSSPALRLNNAGTAVSYDARGVSRFGLPADSGAYQSRASLSIVNGQGGSAPVLGVFPDPLQVIVRDDAGNPIPSEAVTFNILSGQAFFQGSSSWAVASTQSDGIATAPQLVASTQVGNVVVEARVGNLVDSFSLTIRPDAAVSYKLQAFLDDVGVVTSVAPDQPFNLVAFPVDALGNQTWGPVGPFILSSTDPRAVLPEQGIWADEDGVIFVSNLRLRTPGQQTLTLTQDSFTTLSWSEEPLSGSLTLTVINPAPSNVQFEVPSTVSVGDFFTLSGSFEDFGDNRGHTVWINWGDGGTSFIQVPPGSNTFSTEYAYLRANTTEQPDYTIRLSVFDADNSSSSAQRTIRVSNVPPIVDAGGDLFLNVGDRLRRPIFISHPSGGPYLVYVNYGDGTPEVLLEPEFSEEQEIDPPRYFLNHIYQQERSFPVTIRVVEPSGAQGFAFFIADVLLPGINPKNASKVSLRGENDQTG
ncbi:MAG: choice-of-anchor Q domain-containing protein, partial [Gemmataceae bacterium]